MNTTMRQVFLVGVDHRIQYINASCGPDWRARIRAFEDYLVSQASELSADCLAEEFSEELVAINSATACTVRDAAARAKCAHCFCEAPSSERAQTGAALVEARENYWLERIRGTGANRIIFVCGNDHLSSFTNRLQTAGYSTTELSRNWGVGWEYIQ